MEEEISRGMERRTLARVLQTDAVVVGSGLAGCFAALELNKRGIDTIVVEKGIFTKSGSSIMASRFSVHSFDPNPLPDWGGGPYVQPGLMDDPVLRRKHGEQTSGNSQTAWSFVAEMENMGVYFRRFPDGRIWPESGAGIHSMKTDQAGKMIMQALGAKVRSRNIKILEMTMATAILTRDGHAIGLVVLDVKSGEVYAISSKALILATGSTSWYPTSTTPETLSGDGFAMSYRVGAELADLCELIFYNYKNPEVPPRTWRFSVAAWNIKPLDFAEGEVLNAKGEKIWEKEENKRLFDDARAHGFDGRILDVPLWLRTYVNAKEIISSRGTEKGGVYITYRGMDYADKSMRETWVRYDFLKMMGLNPAKDKIEIGVVPHIDRGGIVTDSKLQSVSVPGLYAIGGMLSGVGGLIGCVATGKWVAESVEERISEMEMPETDDAQIQKEEVRIAGFVDASKAGGMVAPSVLKRKIKQVMQAKCPYWKDERVLTEGLNKLQEVRQNEIPRMRARIEPGYNKGLVDALETANLLDLCEIHIEMALMKNESRGFFRRTDHPEESKFFTGVRLRLVDGKKEYHVVKVPIPGF